MSYQKEQDSNSNETKEMHKNFEEENPHPPAIEDVVDQQAQNVRNDKASIFCSDWIHIIYLSIFSVIGVTFRSFIGRLFGGDCDPQSAVKDWLYPLSHRICVTTNGRTEQYGGALFIDLPDNMFGSFIIG